MADGYGFAAEGDWKTAALVRAMKVMSHGLKGGVSFMEDYTYHLDKRRSGAGRAHAGSVSVDCSGHSVGGNSSALHWRQSRSCSPGVYRRHRQAA